MKNIKFLHASLILLVCNFNLQAQTQSDTRKFIEVTGSAEMTIEPDEIQLEIVLSEYDKNGQKIKLDKLESDFYARLKKKQYQYGNAYANYI